jgi:ABC-type siderophore export system fused ATPase/permease subunit
MSGGGKSTFVNLVTRFYEPKSGRILLDGVPYQDITLPSLREQLAMVSQNVVLFDDTLKPPTSPMAPPGSGLRAPAGGDFAPRTLTTWWRACRKA